MNQLESYIHDNGLNEVEVMNRLQGFTNLISDCCVWAKDVAKADAVRAVDWLKTQEDLK